MYTTDCRSTPPRGFTLIELVVGIAISGLLAGIVFQLIQGQGRFVSLQSARQEVQQNSRGALELIASELRAVPAGGIDAASANSVTFKLPRTWGILCDVPPEAGGTVGVLLPPGSDPATELAGPFSGAWPWGVAVRGVAAREYVAATLTGTTSTVGQCAGLGGDGGTPRQVTFGALSGTPDAPRTTAAFLYQTIGYDAAASSSGGPAGIWIRRQVMNAGTPQPMAGPLSGGIGGLSFTYFCNVTPLTDAQLAVGPVNLRTIDRIRVRVSTESRRSADRGVTQQETDSVTIHLRNNGMGAIPCPA